MKLCLFGAALVALSMTVSGCGTKESAASRQLNLYIWNDYLADDTVANFEKETGITVAVSNYGSNEELDSKLAPGQSGYDIVVPSASYYERQITSGYYQRIDKTQLPNLGNLDPEILERIAVHDPGNEYAVIHMWGTTGIGYNVAKVKQILGADAKIDSWDIVFKPENLAKFRDCGVHMLDSADDIFPAALSYLGLDPNSTKQADLEKAADVVAKVRPSVRKFHSSEYLSALATGEICFVVGWSGDIMQARARASEERATSDALPHGRDVIRQDLHRPSAPTSA